jgi:FkbM family methyltransferase
MIPETKMVHGYVWPACDVAAAAVIHDQVHDALRALPYVTQRQTVIQAGGNTGVWPNFFAQHFAHVYTFEPEPLNFQCLLANCADPRIIKHEAALGHERGNVHMSYPAGRSNMGACQVEAGGDIPMLRIDDCGLTDCDLIQLDLEGYEPQALLGATQTIERFSPVIMVEDKGLSERYGIPRGWAASETGFLYEHGYRLMEQIHRDWIFARLTRK